MKTKYAVALLWLASSSIAAVAASRNSESVTFAEPVVVQGTQVPAGDYKVQWEGNSGSVQVNFLQGKRVIATAPAEISSGKSEYNGAVETKNDNNTSVLEAIDWSKQSLRFQQPSSVSQPPNSGN